MTQGLVRYQQTRNLHFITFSCYHRQPFLRTKQARSLFEDNGWPTLSSPQTRVPHPEHREGWEGNHLNPPPTFSLASRGPVEAQGFSPATKPVRRTHLSAEGPSAGAAEAKRGI